MPRGRGKVVIEVSRELRDRIRELSQKYGLLYEELLWKALDTLTQSITQSNTQSMERAHTQSITQSTTQSITQSKAKVEEKRRIIVFTLEWARQKGINTEEYMAKKEKEGYICNETSKKVYCIWREDIEQLVVELNSSNARMGELENVLSDERLNIARQAIEAGLLWYDSREKRWKAPL